MRLQQKFETITPPSPLRNIGGAQCATRCTLETAKGAALNRDNTVEKAAKSSRIMNKVKDLEKNKVKQLKDGNDGDSKGEPVDTAKIG